MKAKFILMMTISVSAVSFAGCSASFTTSKDNANAKPAANTAPANTTAAANKNSNTNAQSEKPKTVVTNEKKPEGTAKTANKDVPVPADWVYFYDDVKGYGFSIPEGTTTENMDSNGVDVTAMTTPSGIDIFTLAYKDKTLTKEDLLKDAVKFLEGLGQKVTPGALKAESDDYAVADATTVLEDGRKGKLRILVGTDVTDNYVMILGTETDKFAANEKIIDEIWGSFEMWSGK
jgi:hypothetical protein